MPQARRKTPFSGKAKKQQIQAKKQNKTFLTGTNTSNYNTVVSLNAQPSNRGGRGDRNRYALKFHRETEEELKLKKEEALKSLNPLKEEDLEIDSLDFYPASLSFPKRPPWNFEMTTAQLEAQEQRYFTEYITKLEKSNDWAKMSYFELNIETWRQLWRVLEMSDILLVIADVRFTAMMFPPSLYEHVIKTNRNMIVVLNKVDLVPASVVAAWTKYMNERYPKLKLVYFTSCPGYNLRGGTQDKAGLQVRRRKGRLRMCVEGATEVYKACKEIVKSEVDLSSWERKIQEEANLEFDEDQATEIGETILQKSDTSYYSSKRYNDGVLTIGCVGAPNVGKSSLLNSLVGRKVVSVSKTPGHTKHFQTIFITPQVRLCDCPGLVFPSFVPRQVQILMGSYPIAQLREPYSTIRYIAERMDLVKLLRIDHPENDDTWSPRDICDGWAKKKGFLTAKAARLDTYRAANSILRMALDGRICLWLRPPGFTSNRELFENCEEVKNVKRVQALTSEECADSDSDDVTAVSSDDSADSDSSNDESDSSNNATAISNKFAALIAE